MIEDTFNPPLIAIVGRPNVGKSTLFNRLLGRRVAVVHDLPGTTRDRLYGEFRWQNSYFQIVDTGGLIPGLSEGLPGKILQQAREAIAEAGLCLLVVDLEEGLTPLDREVASLLRKKNREVVVVMNKSDLKRSRWRDTDFFELGFQTVLPVSALHGPAVILVGLSAPTTPNRRRPTIGRLVALVSVSLAGGTFHPLPQAVSPLDTAAFPEARLLRPLDDAGQLGAMATLLGPGFGQRQSIALATCSRAFNT